jgi:PTS system fructose-specific IIC component
MKITDFLKKETINLALQSTTKQDVIAELASTLSEAGKLNDKSAFIEAIQSRELQSTTGIGEGIAIPHAKSSAVFEPVIAFGRSIQGVDYQSLDGQPSHLFFMIAVPEGANNTHLETLSRLSSILLNAQVRQQLLEATYDHEIIDIVNKHDIVQQHDEKMTSGNRPFIVAVTACPTGIAHTYMSADSLRAKAVEMDVDIKVETNGSGGSKNVLTTEDIKKAVGVIVAADTKVEMDRFHGKHVLEVPVSEGIRKPQQLIERALKQDAPIYRGNSSASSSPSGNESRSVGATIYKHLMSGVSNMLPFVVGGGILIAICFMFGFNSFNPDDPSYNSIAAALMTIGGGNAFALMVPVLAAFIAMSIADRPGFAPGMVGGMLAASGGAGFLGGIAAGFLAGYLVIGIKKLLANLPQSIEGIKTILLYPLLGIASTGFILIYLVNKPVAALNNTITQLLTDLGTGNAILLGIIVGLMMAFDMGGPINKAAYVFGTGLLASGIYEPMAAIMAAGMVPPLGIALATSIFRNKFSNQDKQAGKVNYILGFSFITEGAIPFAAADPIRVIPSIMAGSAIAGALSMAFGIGLRAPHGGVFVIPLVNGGWFLYLLAIFIGALVTAVLLGTLKKPITG